MRMCSEFWATWKISDAWTEDDFGRFKCQLSGTNKPSPPSKWWILWAGSKAQNRRQGRGMDVHILWKQEQTGFTCITAVYGFSCLCDSRQALKSERKKKKRWLVRVTGVLKKKKSWKEKRLDHLWGLRLFLLPFKKKYVTTSWHTSSNPTCSQMSFTFLFLF